VGFEISEHFDLTLVRVLENKPIKGQRGDRCILFRSISQLKLKENQDCSHVLACLTVPLLTR
jgi:hypothetical protein